MGTQEHSIQMDAFETDLKSAVDDWRGHLLKDQKFSIKRVNAYSNDLRRFFDFYAGHLGYRAGLVDMGYVRAHDLLCFFYSQKSEGASERSIARMVSSTRLFLRFLEETQSQLFHKYEGGKLGVDADVQFGIDNAQTDNAFAQMQVSEFYKTGIGVRKNMKEALRWLKMAGDNDNQDAQFEVGEILLEGDSKDIKEAAQWFAAAGLQGHREAAEYLGAMYLEGIGVPKNKELSERWFSQSKLEEK